MTLVTILSSKTVVIDWQIDVKAITAMYQENEIVLPKIAKVFL
jgi:hypothetical protein